MEAGSGFDPQSNSWKYALSSHLPTPNWGRMSKITLCFLTKYKRFTAALQKYTVWASYKGITTKCAAWQDLGFDSRARLLLVVTPLSTLVCQNHSNSISWCFHVGCCYWVNYPKVRFGWKLGDFGYMQNCWISWRIFVYLWYGNINYERFFIVLLDEW